MMIRNDQEKAATHERIALLERWLAQRNTSARPEEFSAVASDYHIEILRMQREIEVYETYGSGITMFDIPA